MVSDGRGGTGFLRRVTAPTLALVVVAVTIFMTLTTYRLERTGLYFDELHQAVGAFSWVGRPTEMFSILPIASRPVFNMPYSGAIKTTVYGLFLRISGRPFSIVSWRLIGILFSAGGITVFLLLTHERLTLVSQLILVALLLSDVNFLLQSRHDWGPVALAFLLRMLFLGLWVRWSNHLTRTRCAVLGLLVGVAIFEKLSSAVLIAPLAIMLLPRSDVPWLKRFCYAAGGVLVGTMPVIAANIYWVVHHGELLALAVTKSSTQTMADYAFNYLALGNGRQQRQMIFNTAMHPWSEWLEAIALTGLIASTLFIAVRSRRRHEEMPIAATALLCYAAVAVGLRYLPTATSINHWIIGTPFQYLALALVAGVREASFERLRTRLVLGTLLAVLLFARMPAVISAYQAIRDDRYNLSWHPSINDGAKFVAAQPDDTIVIAADWGVGTQIFCMANGRQDFMFEVLSGGYDGPVTLEAMLDNPARQVAIVALPRPPRDSATARRVLHDMAALKGWIASSLEPPSLPAIELRAYQRVPDR
jgi:hypothetical protein